MTVRPPNDPNDSDIGPYSWTVQNEIIQTLNNLFNV